MARILDGYTDKDRFVLPDGSSVGPGDPVVVTRALGGLLTEYCTNAMSTYPAFYDGNRPIPQSGSEQLRGASIPHIAVIVHGHIVTVPEIHCEWQPVGYDAAQVALDEAVVKVTLK